MPLAVEVVDDGLGNVLTDELGNQVTVSNPMTASASRTIKWIPLPQTSRRLIEYRFSAKSSADRFDYSIDFSDLRMNDSDTIVSVAATPSSGITISDPFLDGSIFTSWVEPSTYGGNYTILFVANTASGIVANMLVTLPVVGPETGPPPF